MARMLMVAPDESLLQALRASPLLEGHTVDVAAGDAAAIRRLRRQAFDVLVTAPDTDLDEDAAILDEVRLARPGVRIVLLAPRTTPELVIEALRKRVFACFSAPFDPSEIADMVCRALEATLADDSVIVADGGDFVSTASYVLRPRRPLSWLDPGPFGTLGVGAGFALGAKLVRPSADVWIVYGDGSVGYSLAEADTFARHGVGVVALVGNDAGWTQIAREQVEVLKDDVGTVLAATDYERAAEGLGAHGLRLDDSRRVAAVLQATESESPSVAGRRAG